MSEKTLILEEILSNSDQIRGTDLFYNVSDELFSALYGSSEQVIKTISETLNESCVFKLAWFFKLITTMPEDKITKCQQIIIKQIRNMIRPDGSFN